MAGGMGFEFMPEADQGSLTAEIELQTGLRVDETTKVARKIDALSKSIHARGKIILYLLGFG